ncbi:efflux RND transporter periplasmic adaptor subunit [Caulobacter sp. SLTY]|uniref:efflux RND transporter periplasmic adaptor subunit n=1 Tax=Caulobacter sp. SLTY TaxID=2683262 RepID=UPI001411E478|nr:efflux RND transporter periplasmic adaptor subunit [Caulobacter sp. SLTY]NBB15193.1 efflux RND transporter periplasmic adaptor subunit [Caulobacter sp. SLTY]
MKIDRHWLVTGVAVVIALGAGFGAARLLPEPPTKEAAHKDGHGEEEGHDEGGEDGLVALSPAKAAAAGVSIVAPERGGGEALILPGRAAFAPGAEAVVDAPLPGTVIAVHVGPGSAVRAGAALVTMRSPEGAAARANVDAAQASADAARAALARDRSLFERGFIARARLDITEAEGRRTEAELRAGRARLAAYGSPGPDGRVVVRSPVSGVVSRLATSPGQVLHEEDQEVAAVSDTGRLELVFDAPPGASATIRVGDRLAGRTADGQAVNAVVTAIAPAGERGVVTVRARPEGFSPPAGTVISARLATGRAGSGLLTLPVEAVQTVEGRPSVFVVEGAGFRARPVVTGAVADGRVEIVSGLTGTERVAGAGAFLLKAELAKGEAEHGH